MLRSKEIASLDLDYNEAKTLIGRESGKNYKILPRLHSPRGNPSHYTRSGYDEHLDALVRYVSEHGTVLMSLYEASRIRQCFDMGVSMKDIKDVVKGLESIIEEYRDSVD